jgi:hypothetical protein
MKTIVFDWETTTLQHCSLLGASLFVNLFLYSEWFFYGGLGLAANFSD